jgi:CRISPR-associated protein Cas8a1/Csx13
MHLFAPGMSPLHRAGLGGLACTLQALEDQVRTGLLPATALPAPFQDDRPPWAVTGGAVTLLFGKPEHAGPYLKHLFAFAFAIRPDGLISLPGQFETAPPAAVLADVQAGLTLTFLQHGKVRALAKTPTLAAHAPEADGAPGVVVPYRKCGGFKHQRGWEAFIDPGGTLAPGPLRVDGPLSPGTVVRHVAFTGVTAAEDPPERMLPLYFAPVGCLPLPVNRGVAVLLIPEVDDLTEFVPDRRALSPATALECQVAGGADAALQAQLRLRARRAARGLDVPGCSAVTFAPTPWAGQQKSRVATAHAPRAAADAAVLAWFARAFRHLPTRIATRTVRASAGAGRRGETTERPEAFRANSVVRPLVADNLAAGRPWYAGFARLMTRTNPATDAPYRAQLPFERKGLAAMVADPTMWDHPGERLVVQAVHEAIGRRLGQIGVETDGWGAAAVSPAAKARWERFRERLRLALAGAKTEAHVRFALVDLFSRAGPNATLQAGGWAAVLPVVRRDWRLARDLGLLALASYAGRGADGPPPAPPGPAANPE